MKYSLLLSEVALLNFQSRLVGLYYGVKDYPKALSLGKLSLNVVAFFSHSCLKRITSQITIALPKVHNYHRRTYEVGV